MPSFVQSAVRSHGATKVHVDSLSFTGPVNAHGAGLSAFEADVPAIAEALERYCSLIYSEHHFTTAMALDLGNECLDLDTVATVSATEAAHPKCPIKKPSQLDSIRWVRGVSLTEGRPIYIPAVMVYSRLQAQLPGERFWLPISTGCAAHTTLDQAIRSGLFEVAERDALSLTWLQKLPLPQIIIDQVSEELNPYLKSYERSSVDMEFRFYDATTDIGIPAVYGIRLAPARLAAYTAVACSAASTISRAIAKVMRDLVSIGQNFEQPRKIPESLDDFTQMLHGATYMARSEHAHAFDFLLNNGKRVSLRECEDRVADMNSLPRILASFRKKGFSVLAVDLTTAEARKVGMIVVRVIVPALQPLSFNYTAQYKGHTRLYAAPIAMGYKAYNEENLNQWPQPFA
jgi:ribosomal protein S12 methylthiotransferase accessory factor